MYYVYLLEKQDDHEKGLRPLVPSWYLGYTSDLKRRVSDHNSGNGGQTTSRGKAWNLIYYESYINKLDALGREKFLKSGSGRKYLKKQLKNYLRLP